MELLRLSTPWAQFWLSLEFLPLWLQCRQSLPVREEHRSLNIAAETVLNMADEPTATTCTWALATEASPTIAVRITAAKNAFVPLISVFSLERWSVCRPFDR